MSAGPPSDPMTRTRFEARLAEICLRRGAPGLPQSTKDCDVLFKSVLLFMGKESGPGDSAAGSEANAVVVVRNEPAINDVLKRWLADVGRGLETDHVSLRRALVDAGWLTRTGDGREYRAGDGRGGEARFAPDVDGVVPHEVVRRAVEAAERKKRERGLSV